MDRQTNDLSMEIIQSVLLTRNKIAQWHKQLRRQFFKLIPGFFVRCRQENSLEGKSKYKVARIRSIRPDWSIELDVLTHEDLKFYERSTISGGSFSGHNRFSVTNYDCVSNSAPTAEEYAAFLGNLIDRNECTIVANRTAERLRFVCEFLMSNQTDKKMTKSPQLSPQDGPDGSPSRKLNFSLTVHLIREGDDNPRDVDIFSLISPHEVIPPKEGPQPLPEPDTPSILRLQQYAQNETNVSYASLQRNLNANAGADSTNVFSHSTINALLPNKQVEKPHGPSETALELLRIIHSCPQGLGEVPSKQQPHLRHLIDNVLKNAHTLLSGENLFLRVQSPVYVFGDIHGNLSDLNYFLSQIMPFNDWQMRLSATSILFLGDYVDRGEHSIECLLLLLCLKILCPARIFLLRGNHESPEVNGDYALYGNSTYRTQCVRVFGPTYGFSLWNQSNELFANLALCATIDNTIFCVHGGIPQYTGGEDNRLQMLMDEKFPRLFRVQDEEAIGSVHQQMVNDMLWSDPAEVNTPLNVYGFGPNLRGPDVVSFGSQAISDFCGRFGFQYIFRAHQEKAHGLRLSDSARVVTIFSTSDYAGHQNGAGCIFVSENTIRLIIKPPGSGPFCDT